jgi:hypothetical protein
MTRRRHLLLAGALTLAACAKYEALPEPGIHVEVHGPAAAEARVWLRGPEVRDAFTDVGGRAAFAGLADGAYEMEPTGRGFDFEPRWRVVVVSGGEALPARFESVPWRYAIDGQLVGPLAAFEGAQIRLSGPDPRTAVADREGRFVFEDLEEGQYTLDATKPGFTFQQEPVLYWWTGRRQGARILVAPEADPTR